jgi:hypothetical protein
LLLASAIQSLAIEGLKLSLQCSNVVLHWPSVAGDAYFIRYRPDLTTNSSWTILTNAYPAASGTNMTYFVHSNALIVPVCPQPPSTNSGGTNPPPRSPPPSPSSTQSSTATADSTSTTSNTTGDANGDAASFLARMANLPPPKYPPLPPPLDPDYWKNLTRQNLAQQNSGPGGFAGPNNSQAGQCGFYEVVKVGIHLYGVTNGMVLSGIVPLNFEFANGDTNGVLSSVSVLNTNDLSFPFGETAPDLASASNYLTGSWDTTRASNGVYIVEAMAGLNDGTYYFDHPVTVTVSNLVSFVDPFPYGGQAVYVGVKTVYTNGTWHLDIYNDQNQHVGSVSGPVDANGWCAYPGVTGPGFSLNNTDAGGNQLPSTFYSLAMKTTSPDGTKSAARTNITFIETWPSPFAATIAYSWLFPNTSIGDGQQMDIMNGAYDAENIIGHLVLSPPANDLNPFRIITPTDWSTVLANLNDTSSRDLFWTGDGGAGALGRPENLCYQGSFDLVLHNHGANYARLTKHPYRFVFLWGCNTADGTWPETFGIPHSSMTIADFTLVRGIPPRAFVGFAGKVSAAAWKGLQSGNIVPGMDGWINNFWWNWTHSNTVLTNAISSATVDPYYGTLSYQIGTNGLTIYGAVDLISNY